jgi:hypothetical protein
VKVATIDVIHDANHWFNIEFLHFHYDVIRKMHFTLSTTIHFISLLFTPTTTLAVALPASATPPLPTNRWLVCVRSQRDTNVIPFPSTNRLAYANVHSNDLVDSMADSLAPSMTQQRRLHSMR